MSPVHGKQGQPYARPGAPSQAQNQWGQGSQGSAGRPPQAPGHQNAGYGSPDHGPGSHPQQRQPSFGQVPYGQPQPPPPQAAGGNGGYSSAPYGGSYGQPDYPSFNAAPTTAGRAAPSYAPQFEPLAPPPAHQSRGEQPQRAVPNSQGYAAHGYDYAQPGQPHSGAAHSGAAHSGHQAGQAYAPHGHGAQANPAWGAPQQAEAGGFDLGGYSSAHQPQPGYGAAHEAHYTPEPGFGREPHFGNDPHFAAEPQFAPHAPAHAPEWPDHGGYAAEAYGHDGYDQGYGQPNAEYANQPGGDLGFGQAAGGELDQGYLDEEGQEYEEEAPSRARRPLMMAAVLAGAIVFGGGMTYGYKAIFGGSSAGDPPVIKSAAEPSKFKPADSGGKQFAHRDSKIMGRLGDGSATAAADAAGSSDASGDLDANGARKVSTLVVGRDGSIQAPPVEEGAAAPSAAVAVPGLTLVDGLGTGRQATPPRTLNAAAPTPPSAPQKPVTIANAPTPADTGSIEPELAPAQAAAKPSAKKIKAAVAPPTAESISSGSTSVATTGSGFVAVLASVPRSSSSRMDALKRFADMQQKYAGVLSGKTPDVAEANLGAKGSYHRLVVGPPGSREEANSVCSQLKSQGYNDCWVTAY